MTTTIENKALQGAISDLAAKGITFAPDDERVPVYDYRGDLIGARYLENVVFTKGKKQFKIFNLIFYRISGLSTITAKDKDNYVKLVPVTDQMFYQMIKEQVLFKFKVL